MVKASPSRVLSKNLKSDLALRVEKCNGLKEKEKSWHSDERFPRNFFFFFQSRAIGLTGWTVTHPSVPCACCSILTVAFVGTLVTVRVFRTRFAALSAAKTRLTDTGAVYRVAGSVVGAVATVLAVFTVFEKRTGLVAGFPAPSWLALALPGPGMTCVSVFFLASTKLQIRKLIRIAKIKFLICYS